MDHHGSTFAALVGAELKGAMTARGWGIAATAAATRHSPSAMSRWVNGKSELPLQVLVEVCEVIGADPREIVARAYAHLLREDGVAELQPTEAGETNNTGEGRVIDFIQDTPPPAADRDR
ncbi:helix-turn-helix domain-containing protein [Actinomyces bowdenii]|uniref:helix-turn-helix domain-containing protein n=1 Tax=Actinomyces bowdenii TaxID=131109 RepID=UPI00214C3E29|nr:helix-turn-helix transcriptional regulator [Actinomyces bowdenii]MCR2051784.1 helix-turn-helix domain-containing protein [Actinomyces bowdenii]